MKPIFLAFLSCIIFASFCRAQPDLAYAGKEERLQLNSSWFSPNGKLLAAGVDKFIGDTPRAQEIRVWETAIGQLLWKQAGEANFGSTVAFSPDGKKVVLSGIILTGQKIRGSKSTIWDALSRERLLTLETKENETVWSVVFSRDGTQIIGMVLADIGGKNTGSIHFWDAQTGKFVRSLEADFNLSASLDFSDDGRFLILNSWRIEQDKPWQSRIDLRELPEFKIASTIKLENVIANLTALSPDNEILAIHCFVRTEAGLPPAFELSLWKRATGKQELVLIPDAGEYRIDAIAFSPDGKQLIASGIVSDQISTGAVWVWDSQTGELLKSWKVELNAEEVKRSDFRTRISPNGKSIVVPVTNDKIELRNLQDGTLIRAFE